MTISDGAADRKELFFGLDPSATEGIDSLLGEVEQPPPPPDGVFDARFVGDDIGINLGEGVCLDIRRGDSTTTGTRIHQLRYQVGLGTSITIAWKLPEGVTARLQDIYTGSIIDVRMSGTDSFVVSDPGAQRKLIMSVTYKPLDPGGSLSVLVRNAEGWGGPGASARVELRDSHATLIGTEFTDTTGRASFTDIAAGSNYSYSVFRLSGGSGLGDEYWGARSGVAIVPGQQVDQSFVRSMPYVLDVHVFDANSNNDVSFGLVPTGANLRFELVVKNPVLPEAAQHSVQGRLVLDRHQAIPYDVDQVATSVSIAAGETRTIAFTLTPALEGAFYHLAGTTVQIAGTTVLTSGTAWVGQPLVVVATDRTPPLPPKDITVQPHHWTNSRNFAVEWINPIDLSGIVAAWYKTGKTPPVQSDDGIRTTSKPCTVSVNQDGAHPLYMWLEDRAGNKDHTQRAQTTLFCDGTPPTGGGISIDSGSISTNTLTVRLQVVIPTDVGGSGISSMCFSNDSAAWSPPEKVDPVKEAWDLSKYGGTGSEGNKTVWVEFADSAGNVIRYSATIAYRTTFVAQQAGAIPARYELLQNFPNPFNPSTCIVYGVPVRTSVSVKVINLLGQVVRLLDDGYRDPGYYRLTFDADGLPSGIYFVQMVSGGFVATRKVLLAR